MKMAAFSLTENVQTERPNMTRNWKKATLFACATTVVVSLAAPTECVALPVDLGLAGPSYWTALVTGTGSITQSTSTTGSKKGRRGKHRTATAASAPVAIAGNAGITQSGQISDSGGQFAGDLYLGDNASAQFTGTYANNSPVAGMIHKGVGATVSPGSAYSFNDVFDSPQQMLSQVQLDAINASTAASKLTATSTLSQISKSLTLAPGVYNLTNFQLTHATLTLSGSGSFVFNISSSFALKYGQVILAGGATESNVLFNYTGTSDVSFSGNASVLHGIILALNASVNLSQGLVVGEIISGRNIMIGSGALVQGLGNIAPPFSVPNPSTVPDATPTIVLGFIVLVLLLVFRPFLACSLAASSKTKRVVVS